jgi:hypothetical protein
VISLASQLVNAVLPIIVSAAVPADRTSEAVATMLVVRGFATAVGAQILAVMLASSTVVSPDGKAHLPGPAAFQLSMSWIAILTLAICVADGMAKWRSAGAAYGAN